MADFGRKVVGARSHVGHHFREDWLRRTVVITSIPPRCNARILRMKFDKFGAIENSFVPREQVREGFVSCGRIRFASRRDAEKSIKPFDGITWGRNRIQVNWAKFGNLDNRNLSFNRRQQGVDTWKVNSSINLRLENNDLAAASMTNIPIVHGETAEECLDWLYRSIFGVSTQPRARKALERVIQMEIPNCLSLRELGKYEFILIFKNREEAEAALDTHSLFFDSWFSRTKIWSQGDLGSFRRVWVELRGLPPQAWNRFNMSKIVSIWGDFMGLSVETTQMNSMGTAKVLVDTCCSDWINQEVILQLEDQGFRIRVLEICIGTIIHELSGGRQPLGETSVGLTSSGQSLVGLPSAEVGVASPVWWQNGCSAAAESGTRLSLGKGKNSDAMSPSCDEIGVEVEKESANEASGEFSVEQCEGNTGGAIVLSSFDKSDADSRLYKDSSDNPSLSSDQVWVLPLAKLGRLKKKKSLKIRKRKVPKSVAVPMDDTVSSQSPLSKKDLRKGRKAWKTGLIAGLRAREGHEDAMIELLARKIKNTEKLKLQAQECGSRFNPPLT